MRKSLQNISLIALVLIAGLALLVAGVRAANQDHTVGGTVGYPHTASGGTYLMSRTLDFSSSSTTGTSGDVYLLLNIPSNTYVKAVGYGWTTGEDSTLTVDIGDGADPDGWVDGANVLTGQVESAISGITFLHVNTNTLVGYSNGKLYTANDTLDLKLNNNADALKITVKAWCIDLNGL
jgi:hypothetical protein